SAHRLVQRRDLVVELIAALVEAPPPAARHFLSESKIDESCTALCRFRETRSELQHVEGTPAIAVGRFRNEVERRRLCGDALRAEPSFAILERGAKQRLDVSHRQRPQYVDPRP